MKHILILSGLLTIQTGVIKGEYCHGVTVNGVCHKEEILHENLLGPDSLTVDQKSNIIYFRHYLPGFISTTARLNLDTKEFKNIEGINGGQAPVVDRNSHDVYIVGSDGLYKYDAVGDKATIIEPKSADILRVYYKDVLYYSLFLMQSIYTYESGESKIYPYLEHTDVYDFVIDNDFIYFTNGTGLYSHKKGTNDTVLYNCPHIGIVGFALDTKGQVHICMTDGIYVLKKDRLTVEKIVDLLISCGCAFDKYNNIVYSNPNRLVRLLPVHVKNYI